MPETFVPYSQRAPQTDDLNVLRDELVNVTSVYGRGSSEACEAFERLFRASCRLGRPLDGLRQFSQDEAERFFSQVVEGPDGHCYWIGTKGGFLLNERRGDGARKTRVPRRWWYERVNMNGEKLSNYMDVIPGCGEKNCIAPGHMETGRGRARLRYNDSQMIGLLQTITMRIGRPPTAQEWTEMRIHPTHGIYKMRFGSWPDAIAAAGLADQYEAVKSKATRGDCLASMREARRLLGHYPNSAEFRYGEVHERLRAAGMITTPTTMRKLLGDGTWRGVIAAVLKADKEEGRPPAR